MGKLRRVRLPNGMDIWAPNAIEAAVVFREIVTERTYERHGVTVGSGNVVFDIGANVGLFTAHLAHAVADVRIHAFEPVPALFEALERNVAEHAPQAVAHRVALGAPAGEAVAAATRDATRAEWATAAALADFEVRTVSAMLTATGVDAVDLARIDAEGAEEHVLAGIADADWPRIRQLVIEVHDVGDRIARLRTVLDARGYRTAHAREDWALHQMLGISTLYAVRPRAAIALDQRRHLHW